MGTLVTDPLLRGAARKDSRRDPNAERRLGPGNAVEREAARDRERQIRELAEATPRHKSQVRPAE